MEQFGSMQPGLVASSGSVSLKSCTELYWLCHTSQGVVLEHSGMCLALLQQAQPLGDFVSKLPAKVIGL